LFLIEVVPSVKARSHSLVGVRQGSEDKIQTDKRESKKWKQRMYKWLVFEVRLEKVNEFEETAQRFFAAVQEKPTQG